MEEIIKCGQGHFYSKKHDDLYDYCTVCAEECRKEKGHCSCVDDGHYHCCFCGWG